MKLTAVAHWKIVDAEKLHRAAENSQQTLYSLIQLARRQVVGGILLDEIIENKTALWQDLLEIVKLSLDDLGEIS